MPGKAVVSGPRRCLMITSVGGHVGEALLDALEPARGRLRIIGVNSRADAAPNFRCDAVHLVPEVTQVAAWQASMRRILHAEDPDLVLPARDGDLEALARLKGEADLRPPRFWSPGPVSAAIVVDKAATAGFAAERGLPFVDTAVDRAALEGMIARHGFPLLAKPRRGTGAKGIVVVSDRAEAEACLAEDRFIFQPFLDPPADLARLLPDRRLGVPLSFALPRRAYYAVIAAVTPGSDPRYLGATQVETIGAQSMRIRRADDRDLGAVAMAFAEALAALDYAGILNLQCLRDRSGRAVVFELNGRIAGGVATRATLGFGEKAAILDALFGTRTTVWPPADPPIGMLERGHGFHTIPAALAESLEMHGVWRSGSAASTGCD